MTTTTPFNAWVTCRRPNPQAGVRLFCFPYAGGGASIFHAWPDELPEEVEVCAIQLPGRENRLMQPAYSSVAPLVAALVEALRPYLGKPYAFFGHSMGAVISFELVRALREQQEPLPGHLFVSAHRAPHLPDRDAPIYDLLEPEFLQALRQLKGTPEAILRHAELLELMLPLLRADFSVAETYHYMPGHPLSCPISAFGGLADEEISQEELAAWREHTRSIFTLRMLPGNHFFLIAARTALLRAIAEDLQRMMA